MSEEFQQAAAKVKQLKQRPEPDEMLNLYSLYKQATEGDNPVEQYLLRDIIGKQKWDAWNTVKGMSKEEASAKYITLANQLIEKYGTN